MLGSSYGVEGLCVFCLKLSMIGYREMFVCFGNLNTMCLYLLNLSEGIFSFFILHL